MANKYPPLILDDSLSQILISGVQITLKTMFGVNAVPGPVQIITDAVITGDVSGIVGMVQEKSEGVLILSFKKETIFEILGKMFNRKFTEIDRSTRDGVGELTNIIYGMLKQHLNERKYFFKPAIPNVVVGVDHQIINFHNGKNMVIPFDTDLGRFYVEIAVQPHQQ